MATQPLASYTQRDAQSEFDLLRDLLAGAVAPASSGAHKPTSSSEPSSLPANAALLEQLLDAPAGIAKRSRPVALRSAAEQRRQTLRGYRLRNWVDTALHQTERLLFVGAVLVFGYWFVDGPVRDWMHAQQSPITAPAVAASLRPLTPRPNPAGERAAPLAPDERSSLRGVPLPYIKPGAESTSSAPPIAAPADDFFAPRQRPLDAPVVTTPPQPQRLQIPAIGIDTSVKEVFIADGAWEVAEYAAGFLHGTALPGDGNTVMAAHAGIRGAVFRDIGALKLGDDVFVEAGGWSYHYRVRETKSVWPEQVEVLDPTPSAVLTMLTCTNWDTQRLVVVADLVDSKPSPGP
jgi:sortase A